MANVYTGRGYVYSIQYHIVWCVKYRHKIIVGEIEKSLHKLLFKIADAMNVQATKQYIIEIKRKHVHK